ncbi:MAG: isopentenyl-diphosphate Delta-isomerase [Solobacterium sp.]|nr:isopentenyl-diphosphate Delta-isomerase [Solobacterium sp.]
MEDLLIWVDEEDNVIGSGEKMETHVIAQLHRAFSLFIFDPEKQELLLQRRAYGKYHSGGKWSNSCCSHPRTGEETKEAVVNRMPEELGFSIENEELIYCGHFVYLADFGDLSEHELDHVFLLYRDKETVPMDLFNKEEVDSLQWISVKKLEEWMKNEPDAFSAWFAKAYQLVKKKI